MYKRFFFYSQLGLNIQSYSTLYSRLQPSVFSVKLNIVGPCNTALPEVANNRNVLVVVKCAAHFGIDALWIPILLAGEGNRLGAFGYRSPEDNIVCADRPVYILLVGGS